MQWMEENTPKIVKSNRGKILTIKYFLVFIFSFVI